MPMKETRRCRFGAQNAAGEGVPLPMRNAGGDRNAIPASALLGKRPARTKPGGLSTRVLRELVRGASPTAC